MKALVLSPQPFFSPRGTPLSVYYRTLVAAELGVTIDLLTYGEGQDVQIPDVNVIRIPAFGMFGRVKVGPSYLKLFLDTVLFFKCIQLLIRNRYDFVHAHEEAVFFCLILRPLFGFKLVYDMHSSLPQQLTNFKFTKSGFLIDLFEKLETRALRSAAAVVTICEDLFEYANTIIPDPTKNILIENSLFDPIIFADSEDQDAGADSWPAETMADTIPDDKLLIVYAGTLEAYQGISMVLESYAQLLEKRQDVFLIIAGGNPTQIGNLTRQALKLGISEFCTFTGPVSRATVTTFCRRARVLLSSRISGTNTPLKIYEQLASGIPIVATDIYAHTQVLTDDVAYLVQPDPESFAKGIGQALRDGIVENRRVENARTLYRTKYDRAMYKSKMNHLLTLIR